MSLKCILQGQDLSKESLEAHIADKHNPHEVTAEQIGAATLADIPTSLPASDVYSWAKQPNKPSYTYSEIGAAASNHNHNNLYPTLTDFNSLKTSVSNGKSAVASAITDKGVSTSATASFDTMAGNIRSISSIMSPIISDYGAIMAASYFINVLVSDDYPIRVPTTIVVDAYYYLNRSYSDYGVALYIYKDLVIPFKQLTSSTKSTTLQCSYATSQYINIRSNTYTDSLNKWVNGTAGKLEVSGNQRKIEVYFSDKVGMLTTPYTIYSCNVSDLYTGHYSGRNDVGDGSMIIKDIIY